MIATRTSVFRGRPYGRAFLYFRRDRLLSTDIIVNGKRLLRSSTVRSARPAGLGGPVAFFLLTRVALGAGLHRLEIGYGIVTRSRVLRIRSRLCNVTNSTNPGFAGRPVTFYRCGPGAQAARRRFRDAEDSGSLLGRRGGRSIFWMRRGGSFQAGRYGGAGAPVRLRVSGLALMGPIGSALSVVIVL